MDLTMCRVWVIYNEMINNANKIINQVNWGGGIRLTIIFNLAGCSNNYIDIEIRF